MNSKVICFYSVMCGDFNQIKNFFESYVDDILELKDVYNRTPLHYAILCFSPLDTIKFLIEFYKSKNIEIINHKDNFNNPPLYYSVLNNSYETTKILLQTGADPNYGENLLTIAILKNNEKIFNLLILYGADPKVKVHTKTIIDIVEFLEKI